MTLPAIQTALNAVSNSSRAAVTIEDVLGMLATGEGQGHRVRALFEDCSRETLIKIAVSMGLNESQLLAAYINAKTKHYAANEELDACLAQGP